MSFACIYIPNFIFQAAARSEMELRQRPVAIVEGKMLVVAVNSAALDAGVKPGVTAIQAAQVAAVEIRPRAPAQEQIAHAVLLDLGFSFSPRVEDTAADTIVLDLAGLENLLGSPDQAARRISRQAAQLGFEVHIATASELEAALQAARGFAGVTSILAGEELERLGNLPLEVLGPAEEILETLHRWGIRTLRALAALPTVQLAERLGQEGVELQARARGTFWRPLIPVQPYLQFEEVMEPDCPVEQLDSLAFVLGLLLNRLCPRLKARALAVHELLLEMDLDTRPEAEQVEARPASRYEKTLRLPVPTGNVATLLKLLQLHLSVCPPAGQVTRVRIKAEAAKPRCLQGGLFLPAAPDPEKLEVTLARLTKLVGEGKVGSPELVDTHRRDAFRVVHFNPFESKRKSVGVLSVSGHGFSRDASPSPTASRSPLSPRTGRGAGGEGNRFYGTAKDRALTQRLTALRIFRPPLLAKVQTRDGLPVRVFFGGNRGEVVAAAGPWRTSGDWWSEDGWQCEEWEVEVKVRRRIRGLETTRTAIELALYRMVRDLRNGDWFVEANYD